MHNRLIYLCATDEGFHLGDTFCSSLFYLTCMELPHHAYIPYGCAITILHLICSIVSVQQTTLSACNGQKVSTLHHFVLSQVYST